MIQRRRHPRRGTLANRHSGGPARINIGGGCMHLTGSHWYRYLRIIALAWHPSIREPVYSCGTVIDLDLTVKRRDPNAPIRLNGVDRIARVKLRIWAPADYELWH